MATSVYSKQNNVAASGNWKETRGFFLKKDQPNGKFKSFIVDCGF